MSHTPGPWIGMEASENTHYDICQLEGGVNIAEGIKTLANARLIAASPDLLEACNYAVAALREHGYKHIYGLYEMEAAIAKATGGTDAEM